MPDLMLFGKKEGREGTKRLFWRYIRDFACLALIPVIGIFTLPPAETLMISFGCLVIDIAFYMHVRLSMRIRRLEERVECQRYI